MLIRDRRPLSLQVGDRLRELILTELQSGDRVPSEWDLVARFAVGRTTVRESLKLLEQEGLIATQRGRGRFVRGGPHLQRPVTRLESVTEMTEELGFQVTSRVLGVVQAPPTDVERQALELREGDQIVRLRRLRLQEQVPLIYSVDVFPRSLIDAPAETLDWSGSLLDRLDRHGLRITAAAAAIKAVHLPDAVAREIGLRTREPWLLMEQTNYTEAGRPVLRSHDYHRGDSFTFDVLRRRPGPSATGER